MKHQKFNPKQNNERCLWKMSYSPKNSQFAAKSPGLEDDFPIESGEFLGSMLVLGGE